MCDETNYSQVYADSTSANLGTTLSVTRLNNFPSALRTTLYLKSVVGNMSYYKLNFRMKLGLS